MLPNIASSPFSNYLRVLAKTEIQKSWKNLPNEILEQVFCLATEQDLCNLALVCKAWVDPAKQSLYSNLLIRSRSHLEKFYYSVKANTHVGAIVRKFSILDSFFRFDRNNEKKNRVALFHFLGPLLSLYLPNLEDFTAESLPSYIPILDALTDFKLKYLRNLRMPLALFEKAEVTNYVTCALLMKDRLETLNLRRLPQFERLSEIEVTRKSSEVIQQQDYIVESCKSLKKIRFDFKSDETDPLNSAISMDAISKFIPRPNVKTLFNCVGDEKTLAYIMHKFTKLTSLELVMRAFDSNKLTNQPILDQLLSYLIKIDNYIVKGIKMDHHSFIGAIGKSWKATSSFGSKDVDVFYWGSEEHFIISRKQQPRKDGVTLSYPASNIGRKHLDFVKENGDFIGSMALLILTGGHELSSRNFLPEDFMTDILTYCPNLKDLSLRECVFKGNTVPPTESSKNYTLDKLRLDRCTILAGVPEQWSLLLSEIKHFELSDVKYRKNENTCFQHEKTNIELFMPHTKVDSMFIQVYLDECVYIKLSVSSDKKSYYYRLERPYSDGSEASFGDDYSIGEMEISSEAEYISKANQKSIYICCQTKPTKFEVAYFW